jgi:CubicO group peptidase (beta-lactamase class C family)
VRNPLSRFIAPLLLTSLALPSSSLAQFDASYIDGILQPISQDAGVDGISAIIVVNGQIVYQNYYGAHQPGDVHDLASATKYLTAATFMTLWDKPNLGIDLDAPLSSFVPQFASLPSSNPKRSITLRQSLAHTSGLVPDLVLQNLVLRRGNSLVDVVNRVATGTGNNNIPSENAPGTVFAYGNVSYQLAGGIAEQLTGLSWIDIFNQNMAQKLGMTQTFYQTNNLAPLPLLAAGGKSTLEDYSAFLQMILDGGVFNGQQVLSQAAIDQTLEPNTLGLPYINSPYGNTLYGLGAWLDDFNESGELVGFSDPGRSGFVPWIDYETNSFGIVMIDKDGAASTYAAELTEIRQYIKQEFAVIPEASTMSMLLVVLTASTAWQATRIGRR